MPDLTDERIEQLIASFGNCSDPYSFDACIGLRELRARRAECWRLREGMIVALELIRLWHGDAGWSIYALHSPEMKRINASLAPHQPTG